MVDDTGMRDCALTLLSNGFTPLRLEPDSKAPRHGGWQSETPTEDSIHRQFARSSNLGVRCGDIHKDSTALVCIDIDIEEPELIRCVERAIGAMVPCKQGKKGYTYFIRIDREVKTHKILWQRDGAKKQAIDILAKGAQTVIPPSIHPDTKLPYRWVSGTPLWDLSYRELPVYGISVLDEIKGFCKNPDDPIYALNDMEWHGVGGGGNTHDICVRAVSCMVGRKWTDADILERVIRAKQEAAEAAGLPFNWPEANKTITEWISSSREKGHDKTSKIKIDDIPVEIINRYVYVQSVDRMYDLHKGVMHGMFVFNNIHAKDLPNAWKMVLIHPDFRQVDQLTYSPGQPQFCKERNFEGDQSMDCLNTYTDNGITPDPGEVQPFVDLVQDYCDGVEEAYHHVFSFFAYAVQNPGARINHALVLQGDQGVGKDSIVAAMEKVLGSHNYSQVTLQHVESSFNEWLFGRQLIVFQEMLAPGRRNIYNKLKTYITDPVHTVNRKGISLQRIPNRAVYVFLTNYKHALSLDPSDRRMWVWYSKMKPRGEVYYKRYYGWLADPRSSGALMAWLQAYDTSGFNPSAPPPMTGAKQTLIQTSSNDIEQYLRQALEENSWPLGCDLVNVKHLHGALRNILRNASMTMITEALDNLCPDGHLETRPRMGGQRMRLRAIRNLEHWGKAKGPAMVKYYRMPVPAQQGETEGSYTIYEGSEIGDHTEVAEREGPDY